MPKIYKVTFTYEAIVVFDDDQHDPTEQEILEEAKASGGTVVNPKIERL
jgi:hypothetical protein